MALRQPLRDGAAQRLRSAGDLGAVALDDEQQLHPGAAFELGEACLQAGLIGGERLHRRHQHDVQVVLAAEVLLRVLEQPAHDRQDEAALGEADGAGGQPAAVAGEVERQRRPPGFLEPGRQQQGARVVVRQRLREHAIDLVEDGALGEVVPRAVSDQAGVQVIADAATDLLHDRLGRDGAAGAHAVMIQRSAGRPRRQGISGARYFSAADQKRVRHT